MKDWTSLGQFVFTATLIFTGGMVSIDYPIVALILIYLGISWGDWIKQKLDRLFDKQKP